MTADTIHSYCNIVDCIPCAVLYIPVRGPFLKDILLVIVSVNVESKNIASNFLNLVNTFIFTPYVPQCVNC